MLKLTILIPVLNDWDNLKILLGELDQTSFTEIQELDVVIVNDGSQTNFIHQAPILKNIRLTEIELAHNLGHQRAIAVGLCYLAELTIKTDLIVIMDADGEDNPRDIPSLINETQKNQFNKIVFASRAKRSEKITFRVYYSIYKMLFNLLTGKKPRFGNFSCIPIGFLSKIVHNSDFWNHYSASIIKHNFPVVPVPTNRGKRFQGESKMNTTSLILHGLSAISLYLDVIAVKFLRLAFYILLITILTLVAVVYIKYNTNLAIPGWASYIVTIVLNIIVTTILFTFILVLQLLNNRNRKPEQPIQHYKNLIYSVNKQSK